MIDPFLISGPASISFSGGRTSGYMLWRILQAHGGKLPEDVIVLFANTGKEMPQTLDFVQACSDLWEVPITWLEYCDAAKPKDRWRVVDYMTASRNGEPFEAVIKRKEFVPNPVTRFCTSELKIKAMARYILATFGWDEWSSVVGIRADEPRRVARLAVPNRDGDERIAPLAQAGIGVETIGQFWAEQSFDLDLPNMNGKTMHGNCDLCYLKGAKQLASLIAEEPSRADWWIRMEALALASSPTGAMFRYDRPNYAAMKYVALHQIPLGGFDERIQDCNCVD